MTDTVPAHRPRSTPLRERRLLTAARAGDAVAEAQLLTSLEPMVSRLTLGRFLPGGGEREDLAQAARLGIVRAITRWEPGRDVPFRTFARMLANRAIVDAIAAATAAKRRPLDPPRALDAPRIVNGDLVNEVALEGDPDSDPVAKLLARERLAEILDRAARLSELERRAIALSLNDRSRRESARALGVGERAITNALQRGRRKLCA